MLLLGRYPCSITCATSGLTAKRVGKANLSQVGTSPSRTDPVCRMDRVAGRRCGLSPTLRHGATRISAPLLHLLSTRLRTQA